MDNIFLDLKKLKYLGEGAIIGKTVRIRRPEATIIGDHSIIDDFTYISCGLEIGKYCHIASHCTISGGEGKLRIGNFVGVSAGTCIFTASSDYSEVSLDFPSVPVELKFGGVVSEVVFDDFVLLGAQSIVMPGVRLPEGFATTAQTIVRKKKGYQPWTLYGGFNCKKLIERNHEEVLRKIQEFKKRNNF